MDAVTTHHLPFSRRGPTLAGRAVAVSLLAAFTLLLLAAIIVRPSLRLVAVVPETYIVIEVLQVWLWLLALAAAGIASLRQERRRGLLLALWLGMLALLAGLREMDLHVLLNPGNIHLLGLDAQHAMRFRSDWWLEGHAPLTVRFVWALLFLALGVLIVVPFALARYPWPGEIARGKRFAWLVVGGFLLLLLGFLLDDAIGRPLAEAEIIDLKLLEELTELAGQLLVLVAILLLALRRADLCCGGSKVA